MTLKDEILEIKPYDERLSQNLSSLIIKIIRKHISLVPDENEIKRQIMKLVDRKVVLYKDWEEDVIKSKNQTRDTVLKILDDMFEKIQKRIEYESGLSTTEVLNLIHQREVLRELRKKIIKEFK